MEVNIRIRLLVAAISSIVFLMFGVSLLQNDYALACEGSITKICSILGDDPKPSILDQDIFKFYGTKGEKVTVHLGINPSGSHIGNRATLILMDNIKQRWFFREDRSTLDNEIRAILPATGEYLILVNEQPKFLPGKEFKGAYCLTLESAKEAWLTLEPTSWVEPDASAVIGPKGGIIEVTDPENELYRVRVDIPPGSLDGNKAIVIDRIDIGSVLPEDTTTGGIAIDLKPDGTVFNNNIFVTLPYDDNDNDGLVDHTGIPEENIKVITWDSNTHTWINEDIIGQDKQNNTVTFATNHFSPHTTSVECIYSNDVSIFTIDGLDFVRTFFPIHFNYPSRVNYLLDSLLDMNIPGINKCDIYSFGGLTPDKSWNGDATKTKDLIKDLNNLLVIFDLAAKKTGKKFIVVSHSWGTQLATFAMSYSGLGIIRHQIQPDLFITLSNPAGSNLVSETQYSNDFFYESTPPPPGTPIYVSVKEAQSKVENFVNNRKQEVIEKWGSFNSEMIPPKWINYWDVGDIFSGPLETNNAKPTLDDETVRNDEERNIQNTAKVHAITSLNKKNWKKYRVEEQGRDFSNKVKSEIQDVIEEGSHCSADTLPTILNPNFINGGAESTTSTTLNINLTARDECGITNYWVCGEIKKQCILSPSLCPISPEEIYCALNKPACPAPFPPPPLINPPANEYTINIPVQTVTVSNTVYGDILNVKIIIYDAQGNCQSVRDSIRYEGPTTYPVIAMKPMSGPPGTTFIEWGTGFTLFSKATLHFLKPDGTEYPSGFALMDSVGHFQISYTAPLDKPVGWYTWWAIDDVTGLKSNEVSYEITSGDGGGYGEVPP